MGLNLRWEKRNHARSEKVLTKQFMSSTRVLCSPHTPVKTILATRTKEESGERLSIFVPALSVPEDKGCHYAFMLCPTEHCPQHTYMSAFQYCTVSQGLYRYLPQKKASTKIVGIISILTWII
jgi:hypothetical protein